VQVKRSGIGVSVDLSLPAALRWSAPSMMCDVTTATTPLPPALCILGAGLIGGSLMRAVDDVLPVSAWSPSSDTRAAVAADGFSVHDTLDAALEAAAKADALVVLAAPITEFGPLVRAVDRVAPTVALTDVAGVKAPVAELVDELAPRARYVGSHPMAGTQHSGWAAGSADLFRDAAWVTCLTEDSDQDVWASIAGLALTIGSRVVPVDADAHDAAVARVSHLPHLLALTLAQVGAGGGGLALALAAGSFADGTRVAASRPELVRAMCEGNRDALLAAVDDALGILGVARGSLASTGSLAKLTEAGHAGRIRLEQRSANLREVTLRGTDLIDELLSVGAAGGHLTGLSADGAELVATAWYPVDDD
jgi:prephenate dehydrogenase